MVLLGVAPNLNWNIKENKFNTYRIPCFWTLSFNLRTQQGERQAGGWSVRRLVHVYLQNPAARVRRVSSAEKAFNWEWQFKLPVPQHWHHRCC